jgi:hypothetical protein
MHQNQSINSRRVGITATNQKVLVSNLIKTASHDREFSGLSSVILGEDKKQTPWPESASELYRPSDRRLSVNLVSTFADRGVLRSQRGG